MRIIGSKKEEDVEPIHFIYLTPAVALVALIFAYMRAAWVKKQDEGTDRMKTIGAWVAEGAMAFLSAEYRVLVIFVIAVAILLGVSNAYVGEEQNTNWLIAVSFVLGAFCSALAGYFGMKTATAANTRTASAARGGLNDALQVAFKGGSVMGLSVVGLALLGFGSLLLIYTRMYPASLDGGNATMLVLNVLSCSC
jgi:K(+)-stimulated pyrophosphate-energized sodium pump